MKKFTFIIVAFFVGLSAWALDIPKGTFYFDNSLTGYAQVKFVYGSDSRAETYIVSMTDEGNGLWSISFPEKVNDMYRYTFANTQLSDGKIEKTFSTVKDEISNKYYEYRTATTDQTIVVGGTYTPLSGENWAQGYWKSPNANDIGYSGTLPVMYINTDGGVEITSTEDYVNATYYLDNMGIEGIESIASPDSAFALQIRGRGNYTWRDFDKKPYRLKFDKKAAPLGMNKSKHFALLAHADDQMAFLRNTVGFELSRRLGLKYTPAQQPLEVVLNGKYIGLYFLTETIRVAKDRVNIVEQPDTATDATTITGGWLVEIDNYDETEQVRITEGNGEVIRFTYKTPEILSTQQERYLRTQMIAANSAIYSTDKSSETWEHYIDMDSLARFYIVQEVMDNAESFHGSCYLHKDQGKTKWIFGPVWDFGNSYRRNNGFFIYQYPPFGQTWIGEIAKYPRFQQKVVEVWQQFKGNDYEGLDEYINSFVNQIYSASQSNYIRWPQYGNGDIEWAKDEFVKSLDNRIAWLVSQWGEGVGVESINYDSDIAITTPANGLITIASHSPISSILVSDISGKVIAAESNQTHEYQINCPSGIYIVKVTTLSSSITRKVVVK
ncbi:MAG: CotH kinase family protein [Muribaculaceae bacterium]|nr:CotH kinase family protein [Muribaculaceae bacterium]MBQ7855426.1 CotH kinase family protein [Muribaculaceae bacterium]